MKSVAIQVEHALQHLPPARRAELEQLILKTIASFSIPREEQEAFDQQRKASLMALAGSIPDFPDDVDEVGAWRVDPVTGERHLIPSGGFKDPPRGWKSLEKPGKPLSRKNV
jgi:hypothetical protein